MQYDAIIVGGSFAGLSAAMQLARGLRKVCIIDGGKPRNRFAKASHGFFGQDGAPPYEMIAQARDHVLAYPSVSFMQGEAKTAKREGKGFALTLADGSRVSGRKIVLAYGMVDQVPKIPGAEERWGKTVVHCPYCHGFEFAGKQLGVLATSAMYPHQAQMIPDWGPTTLFLQDQPEPDAETLQKLQKRGVTIEHSHVVGIEGDATVKLADGRTRELAALYVAPPLRFASDLHEQLGCALDDAPLGKIIRADDKRETSVSGVYAAGDIARMFSNATLASADGVMAGAGVHFSLIFG